LKFTPCPEFITDVLKFLSTPVNAEIRSDICAYWKHVSSMVDTAGGKSNSILSFVAKAALTLVT